jgi:hypothetical protein
MTSIIVRAGIVVVPAALAFAAGTFLFSPDPAPPPPIEPLRVEARGLDRLPQSSWITVDAQAYAAHSLKNAPEDCETLLRWARKRNLSPSVPLQHVLVIRAAARAHVRVQEVYALRDGPDGTGSPPTRQQLTCTNGAGPWTGYEAPELSAKTFTSAGQANPGDLAEDHVFDLGTGSEVALRFAVDPLPGASAYGYDVVVNIEIDGSPKRYVVNEAGRPFQRTP